MKPQLRRSLNMRIAWGILLAVLPFGWATALNADPGGEILTKTGTTGGLIVHVGCGDGELTAKLRTAEGALVHGLDTNWSNVAKARQHIHSIGQYGRIVVSHFDGESLPYCDNLVNLIVISSSSDEVTGSELMRVLAPGGVAVVQKPGNEALLTNIPQPASNIDPTHATFTKPWPADIDEWTHFLHGPDNNTVARDTRVGPPRHVQWLADPMWCRNHHKLASISSVVSSGGRLFYIVDESTGANMKVPGKWVLTARNAFNGVLLWKRPLTDWAWPEQRFRSGPVQLPRTLVAKGDRVYVPLGGGAPISSLDAATGETVRTYDETAGAEEVLLHDGLLHVVTGTPTAEQMLISRGKGATIPTKTIVAVRAENGEVLWRWSDGKDGRLLPTTLAVSGDSVFFSTEKGVVSLARGTGEQRWFAPAPYLEGSGDPKRLTHDSRYERMPEWMSPEPGSLGGARGVGWSVGTLVLQDDVVLWAGTHRLRALSATTGERLWESLCRPGYCKSPVDVLVVGKTVWTGPDFNRGRDLKTGEVTTQNSVFENLWTAGHHHRCYRNKATSRYILTGHRGVEFMDLAGDGHGRNNWTRGVCQYGILPCNGLLYVPTHVCACYIEAKLNGFWAFAPSQTSPVPKPAGPAFEKGPAYDAPLAENGHADQWPTYRGNPARTACSSSHVPAGLNCLWEAKFAGPLSGVTVCGDRLFVASIEAHEVCALDAASGKTQWRFTAGGRVDSPPTVYRGRAYFGSSDGRVTCLRAADGVLAWRRRVAPAERYTVARDGIESLWPVHGSVLIQNDIIYAVAGRSSYLDGGLRLVGLHPKLGQVVHDKTFVTEHPDYNTMMQNKAAASEKHPFRHTEAQFATDWKTFTDPDKSDSFAMEGATDDLLVGDGSRIYMKHLCFDNALVRQEKVPRHLFSTTRLLDGTEHHRTFMMFGTANIKRAYVSYSWIANRRKGMGGYRFGVPYGLMLACDDTTAFGIWGHYKVFSETIRPAPDNGQTPSDIQRIRKGESAAAWNWETNLSFRPRAMLVAKDVVLVGGMAGIAGPDDLAAAYDGQKGGVLCAVSKTTGDVLAEHELGASPVWNGMAVARGQLYMACEDNVIRCFASAVDAKAQQ